MKSFMTKEIASIRSVTVLTFLLLAITFVIGEDLLIMLSFAAGVLLISASTFGNEFSNQTSWIIMSQAVSRIRIWNLKMAVLLLSITFILSVAGSLLFVRNYLIPTLTTSDALPAGLAWIFKGSNLFGSEPNMFPTMTLIAIYAFCIVPFLTLISRSSIGGLILSITPLLIALSLDTPMLFFLACCLISYVAGFQVFRHYEDTSSLEAQIDLPEGFLHRFFRRTKSPISKFSISNLFWKELRLQQPGILLGIAFWSIWLLGMLAESLGMNLPSIFLPATIILYLGIIPLLLGGCSIAQERRSGMLRCMQSLPCGAFKQWVLKVGTVYMLTFIFYAVALLITFKNPIVDRYSTAVLEQLVIVFLAFSLPAISILVSSTSKNTIKTVAYSFFIALVATSLTFVLYNHWSDPLARISQVFGIAQMPLTSLSRDYEFRLIVIFPALVFGVMWLLIAMGALAASFVNFRSEDHSLSFWSGILSSRKMIRAYVVVISLFCLSALFCAYAHHQGKKEWEILQSTLQSKKMALMNQTGISQIRNDENMFMTSPFPALIDGRSQSSRSFNEKLSRALISVTFLPRQHGDAMSPSSFLHHQISLMFKPEEYAKKSEMAVMTDIEIEEVLRIMKDDLDAISQASTKRYAYVTDEIIGRNLLNSSYLAIVDLFLMKANHHLSHGNSEAAFDSLKVLLRFHEASSQSWNLQYPSFNRRRLQTGLNLLIQKGNQRKLWNERQLAYFQAEFSMVQDFFEQYRESLMLYAYFIVQNAQESWQKKAPEYWPEHLHYHLKYSPWRYQSLVRFIDYYETDPSINDPNVAYDHQKWLTEPLKWLGPENALVQAHRPWDLHSLSSFLGAEIQLRQIILSCALERYRLINQRYPENLEQLTPHFLNELPADPARNQPFHYRLQDDGHYLLYSVGWNGADDGGTHKKDLVWAENVYWPY